MLALGVFVWCGLGELPAAPPCPRAASSGGGFVPLVLLGALAMFILPHQFHVGVVECRDERDVRTARWLFPLYLVLIALPVLPLARAGRGAAGGSGVPSDLYVLALPLSQGHAALALFAFLGGLSAATGMVVVSTLTLSLMIGNHWLAPGSAARRVGARATARRPARRSAAAAPRRHRRDHAAGVDLRPVVAGSAALADVGAVSFSALATLAPALAFAVWRPQTPPRAAIVGIVAGVRGLGVVPAAADDWRRRAASPPAGCRHGPFGAQWLAPDALFGLTGWSRLGRAVGASLFVGTLATVLVAVWRTAPARREARGLDAARLRSAGRRFLARERVTELLPARRARRGAAEMEAAMERELAAVLGSASARVLLDAARREGGNGHDLDTVAAIVGEAAAGPALQPARARGGAGEHEPGHQRGRCAAAAGGVEPALCGTVRLSRRVAARRHADRRAVGVGAAAHAATRRPRSRHWQRRLAFMRAGTSHLSERVFPDGSIVEIRGNPMPGGGFVATFTDVTAFRRAEAGTAAGQRDAGAARRRAHHAAGAGQARGRTRQRRQEPLPRRDRPRPAAAAACRAPVHRRAGAATGDDRPRRSRSAQGTLRADRAARWIPPPTC